MLVDDDPALLTALPDFLRFHLPALRIDPVASARIALAKMIAKRYDVIVTDLRMKDLDGLALLRGAKALRPDMPVILFSGHIDSTLASRALSLGAHDILYKGLYREEVLVALKSALETRYLAREIGAWHVVIGRLTKRLDELNRLVMAAYARPNTIRRIQGLVSASRAQTVKSLASLESSMDLIWQRTRELEKRRERAQERLMAVQQESHARLVRRLSSGVL
jgi:DNA-binding NtrC family response regulator